MSMTLQLRRSVAALSAAFAIGTLAACGGEDTGTGSASQVAEGQSSEQSESQGAQQFPDIVDVEVTREDETTASFAVTVSSPYDTPDRYADGWRVLDQNGDVLGEHTLGHDHANEQPFTRTQSDVTIPEGTTEVTIEGRDQDNGYGGETVTVEW